MPMVLGTPPYRASGHSSNNTANSANTAFNTSNGFNCASPAARCVRYAVAVYV